MIVFIDDNKHPTAYYREELDTHGFMTVHLRDPDEAFNFFEALVESNEGIQLVVLDIMMSPGTRYQDIETSGGLRTGLALYFDFRKLFPKTPVIVLTNVTNEEDLRRSLGPDGPLLMIAQKIQVMPDRLAELVHSMLDEANVTAARNTST